MDEARDRDSWSRTSALMWIVASVNRTEEAGPLPWDIFNPYADEGRTTGQQPTGMTKEEFAAAHRAMTRGMRLGTGGRRET